MVVVFTTFGVIWYASFHPTKKNQKPKNIYNSIFFHICYQNTVFPYLVNKSNGSNKKKKRLKDLNVQPSVVQG